MKKKETKVLVNGKYAMSMNHVIELEGHRGSALHGVKIPAGGAVVLPLLPDVRWVVIDYVKNVSDILRHTNHVSTTTYLKSNIELLRECAQEVVEDEI